ncbi:hypothetical protein ACLB2K_066681 [Fragaria x ananassa]
MLISTCGFIGDEERIAQWRNHDFTMGMANFMQWVSYVTQSGRLMHVMMTKIHHVGKVYHLKAKRQMAENLGQVAKFRQRYETATPSVKE